MRVRAQLLVPYISGACRLVLRVLTIARLVETMLRVAVRREDGDLVAAALQPDGRVDHQPLCPSYAQIRVKEDNAILLPRHVLWVTNTEPHMHTS